MERITFVLITLTKSSLSKFYTHDDNYAKLPGYLNFLVILQWCEYTNWRGNSLMLKHENKS